MKELDKWLPNIVFYWGILFSSILFVICIFLGSPWDWHIFIALALIPTGNYLIGIVLRYLHLRSDTGEQKHTAARRVENTRDFLRSTAGIMEIYFYTFLLVFGQLTFLAGWLVIKTIGSNRIWSNEPTRFPYGLDVPVMPLADNLTRKEGASVAIFRIGNLLSIVVAIASASLLASSTLVSSGAYIALDALLP